MAITQAMCTSFKQELLTGTHNFTNGTGDTFKIALFTSSATRLQSLHTENEQKAITNSTDGLPPKRLWSAIDHTGESPGAPGEQESTSKAGSWAGGWRTWGKGGLS